MSDDLLYGVLLVDEFDTPYNSAYTLTDKAIWDLIHIPQPHFVNHAATVSLPPGYRNEDGTTDIHVTSGSWNNDVALQVGGVTDANGQKVFSNLQFKTDAEDEDEGGDGGLEWTSDAKKAMYALGISDDRIYEGIQY